MRISDILTEGRKANNKRRVYTIGLIMSGLMSLVLVLVTVYGQYAGTYLINMTREASKKGIELSETLDFKNGQTTLAFDAINDIEDTSEGFLNIEEAVNTDGVYYVEGQNYLAYTFYLKNTGYETVDVEYLIRITNESKGLGDATFFKVIDHVVKDDKSVRVSNKNFSKALSGEDLIAKEVIRDFKPGDIRKYTFFVWLDGDHSTTDMLGGSIKYSWSFGILNAEGDPNA